MFACCIHRGREAFAQSMLAVALVFVVAIAQCARARLSASHRPSPSRLHAATKPCDRDSSERAERRHTIQVQSLHHSLAKLSSRHWPLSGPLGVAVVAAWPTNLGAPQGHRHPLLLSSVVAQLGVVRLASAASGSRAPVPAWVSWSGQPELRSGLMLGRSLLRTIERAAPESLRKRFGRRPK